jgi:hypothetical protein
MVLQVQHQEDGLLVVVVEDQVLQLLVAPGEEEREVLPQFPLQEK